MKPSHSLSNYRKRLYVVTLSSTLCLEMISRVRTYLFVRVSCLLSCWGTFLFLLAARLLPSMWPWLSLFHLCVLMWLCSQSLLSFDSSPSLWRLCFFPGRCKEQFVLLNLTWLNNSRMKWKELKTRETQMHDNNLKAYICLCFWGEMCWKDIVNLNAKQLLRRCHLEWACLCVVMLCECVSNTLMLPCAADSGVTWDVPGDWIPMLWFYSALHLSLCVSVWIHWLCKEASAECKQTTNNWGVELEYNIMRAVESRLECWFEFRTFAVVLIWKSR